MPVIDLPLWVVAVVNVIATGAVHAVTGYWAHRLPLSRLQRDGSLLRLRRWERDGRWYERVLRIRTWKDTLPEGGAVFAGGVSKRSLPTAGVSGLERFAAETRRAERAHWAAMAIGPLAMLWNPLAGMIAMWCYGIGINVPFVAIQRYNRARVSRVLTRSRATAPG